MLRIVRDGRNGGWKNAAASGPSTVTPLEALAQWEEQLRRIGPNGDLATGFPEWDRLTRPRPFQYVIIAARPGLFKTTWALMTAVTLAGAGKRVLWLGTEMGSAMAMAWILSRMSGSPFRQVEKWISGGCSPSGPDTARLQSARDKFDTLPLVLSSDEVLTLDGLVEATCKVNYDAVFLDYIGLVKAPGKTASERIEAVSETIRLIRKERRVHFVALAQMNREIEKPPNGKPRVPNLADLRGSGCLEADADVVAFLHREPKVENKNEVQLRIEKNRFGPLGIVNLIAKPETKEIYEAVYEPDVPPPYQDGEG